MRKSEKIYIYIKIENEQLRKKREQKKKRHKKDKKKKRNIKSLSGM